ncbi:glycosyltransferase [Geobacter pelophilus]|uniref:Glycosyltransferase n=1 Tax=Geoanaerobacter pelophilus TaxID=60036 RepID=A0AAW4L6F8_9BACT|nr:glycosyltransferase [Geoanaerobacter pelophilus]MBT0663397.1 glycosyltransferase [Geoanaerobacter pelophilus]
MPVKETKNSDSESIKVCYILLHIPVPSETFVINELIALQALGVDVHTVSLWPSRKCHEELMARILNPVYDITGDAFQQKAATSALYPAACKLAERYKIPGGLALQAVLAAEYCRSLSIQHIHSHFATEAALVSLLVSKLTGISFSFTAHAYDIFRLNVAGETFPDRRVKLLVENAAKTITISEYNRNHILSITDPAVTERLEVVHCGIDPERFKPCVRTSLGSVTFLSVGRLFGKKGHEFLLRSFRQLAFTCDARLRIIGDGELLPVLTKLTRELDLEDKVVFIGVASSERVLEEMHAADVFVLHSITGSDNDKEGIPVSIMEACATGLPVVSTRHSGIPELVIDGVNGFLVDEMDCNGFANAMRLLAESPYLREQMGHAGRELVSEKFNLFKETQKLREIFSALIQKSSALETTKVDRNFHDATVIFSYRVKMGLLKNRVKNYFNQLLQKDHDKGF